MRWWQLGDVAVNADAATVVKVLAQVALGHLVRLALRVEGHNAAVAAATAATAIRAVVAVAVAAAAPPLPLRALGRRGRRKHQSASRRARTARGASVHRHRTGIVWMPARAALRLLTLVGLYCATWSTSPPAFSTDQCDPGMIFGVNQTRLADAECERLLVVPLYLKLHKVGSETVRTLLHYKWRKKGFHKTWPSFEYNQAQCCNDQFQHQAGPSSPSQHGHSNRAQRHLPAPPFLGRHLECTANARPWSRPPPARARATTRRRTRRRRPTARRRR